MNWLRRTIASAGTIDNPASTSSSPGDLRRAAESAQASSEWDRAASLWFSYIERRPDDRSAAIQYGNVLNEQGLYREAARQFESLADSDPTDPHALIGLAGVLEREERWTAASEAWHAVYGCVLKRGEASEFRKGDLLLATSHIAWSEYHAGRREACRSAIAIAESLVLHPSDAPLLVLLAARLAREDRPRYALTLYRDYLGLVTRDSAGVYELASLALDQGNYDEGLSVLEPELRRPNVDASFQLLAADLAERARRWPEALVYLGRLEQTEQIAERTLRIRIEIEDLVGARALLLTLPTASKRLDALHLLMSGYTRCGDFERARLICRWLVRRWPLSSWHKAEYALLCGRTTGFHVGEAKILGLLRDAPEDRWLLDAYWKLAFEAGHYAEALRRVSLAAERCMDGDVHVAKGYVMLEACGFEAADAAFAQAASAFLQRRSALVGRVHAAMRLRCQQSTILGWERVLHYMAGDTEATCQLARAELDAGRPDRALATARAALDASPHDRTLGEFVLWLLCWTGEFDEARRWGRRCQDRFGPNWPILTCMALALGYLGETDELKALADGPWPAVNGPADADRQYELERTLACFGLIRTRPSLGINSNAHDGVPPNVTTTVADDIAALDDDGIAALLAEAALQRGAIDIVGRFEQPTGGSELHAIDLAARLAPYANVRLWSNVRCHPDLEVSQAIELIDPSTNKLPYASVIVFIGAYFEIKDWIRYCRPKRVIVLYNTFSRPLLHRNLTRLRDATGIVPEVVFCSPMMAREAELEGLFEPSPIDTDVFAPRSDRIRADRFVLGRHSRDVFEKHHPEDGQVYNAVASNGGQVSILGGTCMRNVVPARPEIALHPIRQSGVPHYLRSLDCYFYRTGTWVEPWGRSVIEAMATALPVVAHSQGGYAAVIENGRNGFLFNTTAEAIEQIRQLQTDPDMRVRMGSAARETILDLVSEHSFKRSIGFYVA